MNRRMFLAVALMCATTTVLAQSKPQASPSEKESATIGGKSITITYCSPRVKGREGQLFGADGKISKDPTYPVWRAGANAATILHTDADLMIGDLMIPKGDYSLYVDISDPAAWVLVVNKQTGQWGTKYDKSQDLGRVKMTMAKPPAMVEELKYTLTPTTLTLAWEDVSASVPLMVH